MHAGRASKWSEASTLTVFIWPQGFLRQLGRWLCQASLFLGLKGHNSTVFGLKMASALLFGHRLDEQWSSHRQVSELLHRLVSADQDGNSSGLDELV